MAQQSQRADYFDNGYKLASIVGESTKFLDVLVRLTQITLLALSVYLGVAGSAHSNTKNEPLVLTVCTEINLHSAMTQPLIEQMINRLSLAAETVSITLDVHRYAWNRCLKDTQNNKIDGLFALLWTPERSQFLAFPSGAEQNQSETRLFTTSFYFFENREQPLDFENLNYGIGAPIGYVVRDRLKADGLLSPINYDLREGLTMVARKKLDAYLVGEGTGTFMMNSLQLQDKLQMKQPAYMQQDLHIAFNKNTYNQHSTQISALWNEVERQRLIFNDEQAQQ